MRGDPFGTGRGQTLPDFVVGIAIFLIAVTLILQLIPQLTLPYEDQEQPIVVQRAASDLGNQLLAAEGQPSALNETCTVDFFERSGGGGCPFDGDAGLNEQLGVASTYSVNVTLRDAPSDGPDSALLCNNGGSVGACGSGDALRVGPAVPTNDDSVATARQRVFVGETEAVLEVGVW